jgi:hypothetical protein
VIRARLEAATRPEELVNNSDDKVARLQAAGVSRNAEASS